MNLVKIYRIKTPNNINPLVVNYKKVKNNFML